MDTKVYEDLFGGDISFVKVYGYKSVREKSFFLKLTVYNNKFPLREYPK